MSYIEENLEVRRTALESARVQDDSDQKVAIWKRILTSPTTVWASSWYLFVQMAIFGIHFIRDPSGGIFDTHEYYMELLFHFGLHAIVRNNPYYLNGFVAFLVLPFFILTLGSTLFFLPAAGFSVDGELPEETVSKTFMYFDPTEAVYGSNIYLFNLNSLDTLPILSSDRLDFFSNHYLLLKMNMLYVPLLLTPIFLSAALTLYYMNRTKKKSLLLDKISILFVLSAITGIFFASFAGSVDLDIFVQGTQADPAIFSDNLRVWDWAIIKNLYERERNLIIDFDGAYHPMSNWITFWVCSSIWVFIFNAVGTIAHRDYPNVITATPKKVVSISNHIRSSSAFAKIGVVLSIAFLGSFYLNVIFLGFFTAFYFYLIVQVLSSPIFLFLILYNKYSNRDYRAQAPFISSLRDFSVRNSSFMNSIYFWALVLLLPLITFLLYLTSKLNSRYSWFNPILLKEVEEIDLPWAE